MPYAAAGLLAQADSPSVPRLDGTQSFTAVPTTFLSVPTPARVEKAPSSVDAATVVDNIHALLVSTGSNGIHVQITESGSYGGMLVRGVICNAVLTTYLAASRPVGTPTYSTATPVVEPSERGQALDTAYGSLVEHPPPEASVTSTPSEQRDGHQRRGKSKSSTRTRTCTRSDRSTTRAPSAPVQTSYDTSTAVDPSTWSHISDPTYGGLAPPPPPQPTGGGTRRTG
ncbi:hypothetical protein MPH_07425 [Macrophomina phaseolina MS6]|uniref:Uncharacterized protein n=1 Tax=Macrophomina phaseolina (strain MS6) TaxID=1126212 RepID=K2RYU5_MACPH|nr:hypothetical protein MPH_07425 [Macrophomina phaseolina MS6]